LVDPGRQQLQQQFLSGSICHRFGSAFFLGYKHTCSSWAVSTCSAHLCWKKAPTKTVHGHWVHPLNTPTRKNVIVRHTQLQPLRFCFSDICSTLSSLNYGKNYLVSRYIQGSLGGTAVMNGRTQAGTSHKSMQYNTVYKRLFDAHSPRDASLCAHDTWITAMPFAKPYCYVHRAPCCKLLVGGVHSRACILTSTTC